MYICLECGRVFERPDEYVETHGLDTPPYKHFYGYYEHFYGCPECAGAYTAAEWCRSCQKWHPADEIKHGLCNDCRDEEEDEEDV